MSTVSQEYNSSESYRIGELAAEGEGFTVHRARETSLDAPCFFHRMTYKNEAITDRQTHAAEALLKRFGAMSHPRTPRVADGWVEENSVVAVEYRADAAPFDLKENNPFLNGSSLQPGDIVQGSLDTLAAMHICGIIHGRLTHSCWGIGPGKRVHLVNTSLDRTIVNCLEELSREISPALSTNLFTRDVAGWAYAMLSMMIGRDLVPDALDERWDDYYHKEAESGLQKALKREPAREFFRACLRGFGPMASTYDTGLEALKQFKALGIREQLK